MLLSQVIQWGGALGFLKGLDGFSKSCGPNSRARQLFNKVVYYIVIIVSRLFLGSYRGMWRSKCVTMFEKKERQG